MRYLSSVSLALVVLMALTCTARLLKNHNRFSHPQRRPHLSLSRQSNKCASGRMANLSF